MIVKDNILLSFPRSGNSWVRYALEFVSKRPTSSCAIQHSKVDGFAPKDAIGNKINIGVNLTDPCIAFKRHRADYNWDNFNNDNSVIILLVRSYKEAIIRHLLTKQYNDKLLLKHIEEYQHCIDFYHKFNGSKILLYYEDMMINDHELKKLFNFLKISTPHVGSFFKNINNHKKQSIKLYQPGSVTSGNKTRLNFHSRKYKQLSNKIDFHMKQFSLYNKYISRYK